uniref:Uncharacterized protein n=1 Tax=Glossina brevipalpis TaxID=37001 RepID=A0A1A9WIV3_9MUSC
MTFNKDKARSFFKEGLVDIHASLQICPVSKSFCLGSGFTCSHNLKIKKIENNFHDIVKNEPLDGDCNLNLIWGSFSVNYESGLILFEKKNFVMRLRFPGRFTVIHVSRPDEHYVNCWSLLFPSKTLKLLQFSMPFDDKKSEIILLPTLIKQHIKQIYYFFLNYIHVGMAIVFTFVRDYEEALNTGSIQEQKDGQQPT